MPETDSPEKLPVILELRLKGVDEQEELPQEKLSPTPMGQEVLTVVVPEEPPQVQPVEKLVMMPPETVMLIDLP